MNQIEGCAGVKKVAQEGTQSVKVTDAGEFVHLSLSTSAYPAALTEEEARHIAAVLINAARRAAAFKRLQKQ